MGRLNEMKKKQVSSKGEVFTCEATLFAAEQQCQNSEITCETDCQKLVWPQNRIK